ncbi:MAG: ABC-F family ATP-binding cassette domain-containing protein [Myxococcales bacterium]|nr:ABC-F family ATP-binding cassette domain-containing protein [Myxococcales bacterium]
MAVLLAEDVHKAFGQRHILTGVDVRVDEGEHIGLVGINGGGKSTLLRILGGAETADHGRVAHEGRVALLSQDPVLAGPRVDDVLRDAIAWHGELKAAYEAALQSDDLQQAEVLQTRLDLEGWEMDHRVDAVIQRLDAPGRDREVHELSGGERRRVALAAVLLQRPDVLLLDEPTNHLDATTTEWLESWITGYRGAVVLVTHDRYLLEAAADRIVEIDRGEAVSYAGSYGDYLVARAERTARMQQQRERQLSFIAREAAWAARSPSARSTKQKARLQRLDALRESLPQLQERRLQLLFETGVPKGSTLVELHGVAKGFGDGAPLFRDVDLTVRPGDRIGIVGANGAGKSTLLRVILGQLAPDVGEVLRRPRLMPGVLDQQRTGLNDDDTVLWAAGDGRTHLTVGDHEIHVAGFLERFAFRREMFEQKVAGLSGGERARLLLAKLMLTGANLLVLDEPTNDLDLLTLRTLEEALLGYDGGVLVVTHDRAFMDRVCTQLIHLPGDGSVVTYADRAQLMTAQSVQRRQQREAATTAARRAEPTPAKATAAPKRLSYKEKQELEELPAKIEALEEEQARIEGVLGDPATYRDRADEVASLNEQLEKLPAEIEALYGRWEALSERA